MHFELDPPRGVGPLAIGMRLAEAREAMAMWGVPEDVPGGLTPGLRVRDAQLMFDLFAHFESDSVLTAVEIWRPLGESPASVTWNGIEIFQTPPDVLLQSLRELGYEVDDSDPRHPCCPNVTIGFDRSGGPRFAGHGLAPWLESVLVAEPGYYSVEVDFTGFMKG